MSCSQCIGLEQETQKWVKSDLAAFRRGKKDRTTSLLIQALLDLGVGDQTLLDIGGGLGVIQLELLKGGATTATSVEISHAYLEAARQEAARRGLSERIAWLHGDFVALAEDVPTADIVTLDRVVCCYPDYKELIGKSVVKAGKVYALVFPKDLWVIRQGLKLMNWIFKAQKSLYVAYIHPVAEIDRIIRASGFTPAYQRSTLGWHVWVYRRA
ncbi:MAG: class I SAM-dependent methyltransferase [Bellilinea sp.]